MSLDQEQVRKIAKLARIRLDDGEVDHFTNELNQILGWVDQLSEVDTQDVKPMASVEHITLPMRRDEVTDGGKASDVLANAPQSEFDCFVVPKVVE